MSSRNLVDHSCAACIAIIGQEDHAVSTTQVAHGYRDRCRFASVLVGMRGSTVTSWQVDKLVEHTVEHRRILRRHCVDHGGLRVQ